MHLKGSGARERPFAFVSLVTLFLHSFSSHSVSLACSFALLGLSHSALRFAPGTIRPGDMEACKICGSLTHREALCPNREKEMWCFICQQKGHKPADCPLKGRPRGGRAAEWARRETRVRWWRVGTGRRGARDEKGTRDG